MFEVIVLAIALSMDAFAVSIGLGAQEKSSRLSLTAGLFFGVFQAFMPFIGYWGGKGVLNWVDAYAPLIAFSLLALIGGKMIYEGLQEDIEDTPAAITHKTLFVLAIATSIDAMAAGFSLNLLDISPYLACLTIGLTTFALSWAGVHIGKRSGTWLESKAEIFGGAVLVLIGFKMLLLA